jgi:hypothetical protein
MNLQSFGPSTVGRVAPISMTIPNHCEGAPSPLGTGDIDTMHALASIRVTDSPMPLHLACLFNEASTGKEGPEISRLFPFSCSRIRFVGSHH